jgi:PhzF family phenazine biosynthesis protein
MARLPLYVVDAFTATPFAGNAAAVCLLEEAADEGWMQRVAAEMNLSETAFVVPGGDAATFGLRWFTPTVEVDLCGHATLASAHVLWEAGRVEGGSPIVFGTRSGDLRASRLEGAIEIDLPLRPPAAVDRPPGMAQALGLYPTWVGAAADILLVELADAAEVARLAPDMAALARIDAHGIIVTSAGADDRYDFVSRYFAPQVGIDEDPVTGSAHCVLGPFWAERLGRTELLGRQASPRGGDVRVRVLDDRVAVGGSAVTVLSGTLHHRGAASP